MNVDAQIQALLSAYGYANQQQLAWHINRSSRAISQWKKEGRIPHIWMLYFYDQVVKGVISLPEGFFDDAIAELNVGSLGIS